MGYNIPEMTSGKSELYYDDETGYIGEHYLARKFAPPQDCERCDKPAAWAAGGDEKHSFLCLQCADEWSIFTDKETGFLEGRMTNKKWFGAFNRFLATKPQKINLDTHNKAVLKRNLEIRAAVAMCLPDIFKKYFPESVN